MHLFWDNLFTVQTFSHEFVQNSNETEPFVKLYVEYMFTLQDKDSVWQKYMYTDLHMQ